VGDNRADYGCYKDLNPEHCVVSASLQQVKDEFS
jgi:hypothetical protein